MKISLMLLISLLMLNCSAAITNPNTNKKIDIGDGSFIDPTPKPNPEPNPKPEEIIITDPIKISEFIKKHNGVYYSQYEDESLDVRYIIDNDKIYNGFGTEIIPTAKTLLGNKLQIYIAGKKQPSASGYDLNDEMYTFNFGEDGNIYLFANAIFHKENYKQTTGYNKTIGEPIEELKTYSGNYYYYDYDDTKKYYILINQMGQIYIDENLNITYSTAVFSNNVLTLKYNKVGGATRKQELHFYADKLIFGNAWVNDKLQYEALKKHDSFSTYNGIYKSADSSVTLTVKSEKIELSTLNRYANYTLFLLEIL